MLAEPGDGRRVVGRLDLDPVGAHRRLERLGVVEGHDPAGVHDRDAVAVLGLVHVVGGQEDRDLLALAELVDVVPDARAGLRVEPDGRLVEEQDARRVHQAAGDLEASLHAAGVGLHRVTAAVPELHHLEHLAQPVLEDVARDAVELGMETEVLLAAQVGVEGGLLEHQADVPTYVTPLPDDVEAGDGGRARGERGQRAEDLDGRGLAGTVGSEEAERLPGAHVEVDAVDRRQVAVALDQPTYDDRVVLWHPSIVRK